MGNRAAPYFNDLAAHYGLATTTTASPIRRSPNYLALWSGSTQGVLDDGVHDLDAPTVADQLEAAGRTWRVYAEHVPAGCFRGATASGGRDGPGTYARKHEPAISFVAVSRDAARCARISDLSSFEAGAVDFALIVPDLCHDMHDCAIAVGDAWLRSFVPRILASAAWRDGGLLLITFDEGGLRNQVATLVLRRGMPAGQRSNVAHDHYGLLRTVEDRFGLPCLARSCRATALSEFLGPSRPRARPAPTPCLGRLALAVARDPRRESRQGLGGGRREVHDGMADADRCMGRRPAESSSAEPLSAADAGPPRLAASRSS